MTTSPAPPDARPTLPRAEMPSSRDSTRALLLPQPGGVESSVAVPIRDQSCGGGWLEREPAVLGASEGVFGPFYRRFRGDGLGADHRRLSESLHRLIGLRILAPAMKVLAAAAANHVGGW